MAELSAHEQFMLELVNHARAHPVAEAARHGIGLNDGLAAGTISPYPKPPLVHNAALADAARVHSGWMLATGRFSHSGAGGSDAGARMRAAGYRFAGSWSWGENIATASGYGIALTAATVAQQSGALLVSPGHRTNLLSDGYREVGIGIATGDLLGQPQMMITQDFARSEGPVHLTGVAFADRDGDGFYTPGEGLAGLTVEARSTAGRVVRTGTAAAGGYRLALPPGRYTVSFSGGILHRPIIREAEIGGANVKVDLILAG